MLPESQDCCTCIGLYVNVHSCTSECSVFAAVLERVGGAGTLTGLGVATTVGAGAHLDHVVNAAQQCNLLTSRWNVGQLLLL